MRVTPNPSGGRIQVEVVLDRSTIADLRIVNSGGSTVRQLLRSNEADSGPHRFSADLTREGAGTYLVVLKTNEGMRWEKAVISQ
ncbi:MAG: T9SS type A sorting domain-containing protein [Flavobacteriales bacterium]|nr:T9SS type A sorting domain-containing protein [Flavobacteriales bacterium]